jgi:pyruvate/2-oxoglutarate dehydrogenase complex dihydrolipoamide acyltransferase (E2) component
MIGYNPIYEYAALPDVERIVAAIRKSAATRTERGDVVAAAVPGGKEIEAAPEDRRLYSQSEMPNGDVQPILVPIMGEGIRNAKIVSLLKNPGDPIALDDELCEVETDKAVYPIQSSFAGKMGEWKTKIGDTVDIGQELGTIIAESVAAVGDRGPASPTPATTRIEPALSPTITRKLSHVIPANLQMDARWDALRKARDSAKKKNGKNAPSPSVMIAWAVVRAMEKHPPFRRLILEDESIVESDNFDLGMAVALEDDRLATAVIVEANTKSWPEFMKVYDQTIEATRRGRVDAMNAPVVITSLGAFGVKVGAPIVVPPSVGTLFVGTAHQEIIPNGKKNETAEVITLSLTFDHRVVNGAGAASFVRDIKNQIENFTIPGTAGAKVTA